MAERLTISIPDDDEKLLEWVDNEVEKDRFSSRSHAVRYALKELKRREEGNYVV